MASQFNLPITPLALQGVPAPGYGAVDLRRYLSLGLREGVFTSTDYKVTQRAGGPGMGVDVAAGDALVQGDFVSRQGLYHAPMDADATGANQLDIAAAHASLPRVDSIILEIKDNQYDGSGLNRAQLRVLTGTATAGANRNNRTGAATVPSSALLLADIEVAATATTISNANISDRRPLAWLTADIGDVKYSAGSPAGTQVGWAKARSNNLSRTVHAGLFARIGTSHGAGDGSTTFGLPDGAGRSPVGSGSGSGLTARTLGQKYGNETITLAASEMPVHAHSLNDPGHGHGLSDPGHYHGAPGTFGFIADWPVNRNIGGGVTYTWTTLANTDTKGTGMSVQGSGTGISMNNAGSGGSHSNVQPNIVFDVWVYHGNAWEEA